MAGTLVAGLHSGPCDSSFNRQNGHICRYFVVLANIPLAINCICNVRRDLTVLQEKIVVCLLFICKPNIERLLSSIYRTSDCTSNICKDCQGVIRDWTRRKHEEHWQSVRGQEQAKGSLKEPSAKRAGEWLNLSRNQLRILPELLTGHLFNLLTLRRLMSYIYIYGAPILDVSRSHTMTQHIR